MPKHLTQADADKLLQEQKQPCTACVQRFKADLKSETGSTVKKCTTGTEVLLDCKDKVLFDCSPTTLFYLLLTSYYLL